MDVDLLGAEMFGRPARLRLALWINESTEKFWQQQAADGAGIRTQYASKELIHLERLGMIRRLELDDPGERRNFFIRVDHPLWGVIAAARAALDEMTKVHDLAA